MNVEYINPFIQSSQNVINQTTGLNASVGKIHIKDCSYTGEDMVILIGFAGEVQGNVIFSFRKKPACDIASLMMGRYPISDLDEIAKSAIAELSNMISGNAANIFYSNNINIDITPPKVFVGENIDLSLNKLPIVRVPLQFSDGNSIALDITYKV